MSHPFRVSDFVVELEGRIFHRTLNFGYAGGYRTMTGDIDVHCPYDATGRAVAFEQTPEGERRWELEDPEQYHAFRVRLRMGRHWDAA